MTGKKLSPEEELEKQYREYKAQFEQWKEKNKGSEGTEGYIQYVKQFEKWEKDVEARRQAVRAKTEQERKQTAAYNEEQRLQNENDAAAKYAEQQKSYMAMHQRAMLEEERQRQQRQSEISQQEQDALDSVKRGPHIQAEPQPTHARSVEQEQRPPLWGPDGAEFPPTDPMFARWNFRAAPPNFKAVYQPPPSDAPITPSWYLMKKMEEKGLFYGYNVNLAGFAEISLDGLPDPPVGMVTNEPPPVNGEERALFSGQPMDLSLPPPTFIPPFSRPPPGLNVLPPPVDFSVPPPHIISTSQ